MSTTPLISIILVVSDDEEETADALNSCVSQSLADIEILCIDGSAAAGNAVVGLFAEADDRVRVIRQPTGTPATDARRIGVASAAAGYVLFLEPHDRLDRDAAAVTHREALDADADLVAFSASVVGSDGRPDAAAQRRLQPKHRRLQDEDILRQLFPEGIAVDDRIWRYLFRTHLLHKVFATDSDAATSALTDDLPILFLACAAAHTYVSVPTPLYEHVSSDEGRASVDAVTRFRLAVDVCTSLSAIEPVVRDWSRNTPNPEPLVDGYESVRLAAIGGALDLWLLLPKDLQADEFGLLHTHVSDVDVIAAAAIFAPAALRVIARRGDRIELGDKNVRSVLLTTNILTTGGVSGVLRAQARFLLDSGFRVTIAAHRPGSDESAVPDGASLIQISGSTRQRLRQWSDVCRRHEIDVVIDHRILYSRDWPAFALAARASRAATIGWIHNFAARPTYNGNDLHSLLQSNLDALAQLIVLSPLDVAFWKLRGIPHTAYLPNPPSPLLLGSAGQISPKTAPQGRPIELVWWGRLEEHTKKVTELVEVAAALKGFGVDFRLRIIGPDWNDMTAGRLTKLVSERGLDDLVDVTGPRHGEDLLDAIDSSDVFVNTSIIEGYPLTIPEAQSRGLPIAMYDLPWLSLVQDNAGVIATPQGDANALADAIASLAADPARYELMSRASVEQAERATTHDFATLYKQLISGRLPAELSPEPTLEDGQKILDLLIFFAEKRVAPKGAASRSKRGRAGAGRRGAAQRSLGARVERKLTPIGHQLLSVTPWLRPVARQLKRTLLRY